MVTLGEFSQRVFIGMVCSTVTLLVQLSFKRTVKPQFRLVIGSVVRNFKNLQKVLGNIKYIPYNCTVSSIINIQGQNNEQGNS